DDAVKRTSASSGRFLRLRLFSLFRGESATPSKAASSASRTSNESGDPPHELPSLPELPPPARADSAGKESGQSNVKKSDTAARSPAGSKDDAVERTDAITPAAPKRRLSDLFRRNPDQ